MKFKTILFTMCFILLFKMEHSASFKIFAKNFTEDEKNYIEISMNFMGEVLYKEQETIYLSNIQNTLKTLELFKNMKMKRISVLVDSALQEVTSNNKLKLFILNNILINQKSNLILSANSFSEFASSDNTKEENYGFSSFNVINNSFALNAFFSYKHDYFNTNILFNFNNQESKNIEANFSFKVKTFNLSYGIDIPIYDRLNIGLDTIYNLFIMEKSKFGVIDYSGYKFSNILIVPSSKLKLINIKYKNIFEINFDLNMQYAYVVKRNKGSTVFNNPVSDITLIVDFPTTNYSTFKHGSTLDFKLFDRFSVTLFLDNNYTKLMNYREVGVKMKYDF